MATVDDYTIGDRVRHPNGHTGIVVLKKRTQSGDFGVVVIWDTGPDGAPAKDWEGHYDDKWMKLHHMPKLDDIPPVNGPK